MEDLVRVLEKTVSSLQSDQNEAVRFIQDYIQRDFTGFLKTLSDVLFEQTNPPVVRAAAGLQLKNQLTARDGTIRVQQQERWQSLSEEDRLYIKERVFRTLGTELFRPSSAPQCVAYIAVYELPEGHWPGLIQALTQNVTNTASTPALRLASLEAIGYICQDIDQSRLPSTDSESLRATLISNASQDSNDIRTAALTALINFSENKIRKLSEAQSTISFDDLGKHINVEPELAEKIVAQMIREERVKGHVNQIDKEVHFQSKNVLHLFDERIIDLCSEINSIVDKIFTVVPEGWKIANAH